jgi:hypothetical protein
MRHLLHRENRDFFFSVDRSRVRFASHCATSVITGHITGHVLATGVQEGDPSLNTINERKGRYFSIDPHKISARLEKIHLQAFSAVYIK